MNVRLIDFMGDRDGIRWGHAVSPEAPTYSRHFMWTYDALTDQARVFLSPKGSMLIAKELTAPELAAGVREIVRERMGIAA